MDLVQLGSSTAKAGLKNEEDVINIFNNWKNSRLAQDWLIAMNYSLKDIEFVKAEKIKGSFKADIQLQIKITIKLKSLIDCQNIQIKLVRNERGYNQVDKRWLKKYEELWNIPNSIYQILQYFVGEIPPYKKHTKDPRRMYLTEMSEDAQNLLINWLNDNKYLIVSDILKGRGPFSAEWVLVIKKTLTLEWALKPINLVMNYYSQGDVLISPSGNIHIGRITMQRNGGDGGRETAKMLQFKIDPTELFKLK